MKDYPRPGDGRRPFTHEDAGVGMLDHLLQENNIDPADYGLSYQDLTFIKECIVPPMRGKREGGREDREWLYDIVNNTISGLDVDKLDYFKRDAKACNVDIASGWNTELMISEALVCKASYEEGARWVIAFPAKRIRSALRWFKTRVDLHRTIYTVKQVKQLELMYCDVLKACGNHPLIRGADRLYSIHAAAYNMGAYTKLDDRVTGVIEHSTHPELEGARQLLHRIDTRDLYKMVGDVPLGADDASKYSTGVEASKVDMEIEKRVLREILALAQTATSSGRCCTSSSSRDHGARLAPISEEGVEEAEGHGLGSAKRKGESEEEAEEAAKRRKLESLMAKDLLVELYYLHHGMKAENPVDRLRFYSKKAKSRANPSAFHVPSSRYPMECPVAFDERKIRLYCRTTEKVHQATAVFRRWRTQYLLGFGAEAAAAATELDGIDEEEDEDEDDSLEEQEDDDVSI